MILAKIYNMTENKEYLIKQIQRLYIDNYYDSEFVRDLLDFYKNINQINCELELLLMNLIRHPVSTDYLVICELLECLEKFTSRENMKSFYGSLLINDLVDKEKLEDRLDIFENKE